MSFIKSAWRAITGQKKKEDEPEPAAMPAMPTEADSLLKAKEAAKKRRKMLLAGGGQTQTGAGQLSAAQMGSKTLLGQ